MVDNYKYSQSPIKEIGYHALNYVPAKIIPALISLVAIYIYTRLLTPNEYGLYILVITIASTVYAFGFNWVGYALWRYFEKYKKEENLSEFLSTIFTIVLIIFIVVAFLWYIITIFLINYIETNFIYLLRVGILVLGVQIGLSYILEIIRLTRRSKRFSVFSSINSFATLFLAIFFIDIFSLGADAILLAIILTSGSIFSYEIVRIYRCWKIKSFYISPPIAKTIFSFGMPQIGIAGGALLLSIVDRYMITAFIGSKNLGIYASGYAIADMSIQLPLGILTLAAIPIVVGIFENNKESETILIFKNLFSIYFVALMPIVFGISALSNDIVKIVLGEQFRQAAVILPWVVIGTFFFGLSQFINTPFQLKEKPHIIVYILFLSVALNIILNLFLIPKFGILGAAYSTFIAYFIYCIVSYKIIIRIFALALPWTAIINSLLASTAMYVVLIFVDGQLNSNVWGFISKLNIGILTYCLTLLLLKERTFLVGLKYVLSFSIRKKES